MLFEKHFIVVGLRLASRYSQPSVFILSTKETTMTLRLGDTAPDFEQESSIGKIKFHDWAGDSWVVLFSHPADFTPVCTTELGLTAKLKPEFDKRNVKAIALSVDGAEAHNQWIKDIEETQQTVVGFPSWPTSTRRSPASTT
jgi:alkyl hydroperoxide reductase subunit AhpC